MPSSIIRYEPSEENGSGIILKSLARYAVVLDGTVHLGSNIPLNEAVGTGMGICQQDSHVFSAPMTPRQKTATNITCYVPSGSSDTR